MRRFTWFNATSLTLGLAFLYLPILLLVPLLVYDQVQRRQLERR